MYASRQTALSAGPASFAMLTIDACSYCFQAEASATQASTSAASAAAKLLSPLHVASHRPGMIAMCGRISRSIRLVVVAFGRRKLRSMRTAFGFISSRPLFGWSTCTLLTPQSGNGYRSALARKAAQA